MRLSALRNFGDTHARPDGTNSWHRHLPRGNSMPLGRASSCTQILLAIRRWVNSLEKRLVGLVYSFADSRKCTPPCPMSRTGHEFCARRKAHFFFNSAVQFTTRLSGADASSVITESTTNRLPSRVTSYWFTPAAVRYIV